MSSTISSTPTQTNASTGSTTSSDYPPIISSSTTNSPPPPIVVVSANSAKIQQKISVAPLRRHSMTKLDIVGGEHPSGNGQNVPMLPAMEKMPPRKSTKMGEYELPGCLAESMVVREKPTLRTCLLVCLLSAIVIVFCLIKLFYWK